MTEGKSKFNALNIVNGETINYTFYTSISVFSFLCIKQLFHFTTDLSKSVSCLIAFLIASIMSFAFERLFVFNKEILNSNIKQIIFFIIRCAVNFGFYRLSLFGFNDLLGMPVSFCFLTAIIMSVLFNYFYDRTIIFNVDYDASKKIHSRSFKYFIEYKCVLLSMAATGFIAAIFWIVYRQFPFGHYTVLRMDLYHQYGPLVAELYDRIIEHKSLIYSWESGGGSSFLGNYFNYLSSPLNILLFLFDRKDINYAISTVTFIRCILASGAFAFYLKKSRNCKDYLSLIFSVFYSFCGYFGAYYWNIMWVDGMILLPFIALGIEDIINKGKWRLYTLSLALLLLSSYYIGFMCCIFSVVYFLMYFAAYTEGSRLDPHFKAEKKYSFKALMNNKFFNRGVIFAASSVTAAALAGISLVPVYMILRNSSAITDTFPKSFTSYFDIFSFLTSHLAGIDSTIRSSGDDVLPNVYSGIISIILIPLYFANNKIKNREKAAYLAVLLFLLFGFTNNCANYIWHAMHFPNDLPFRQSFMYSFILLVMGYRAFSNIKSVDKKEIFYVGMSWIFFVVLSQKFITTKMSEHTIYFSIAFILIWCAFIVALKGRKFTKPFAVVLAVAMCFCEVMYSQINNISLTVDNKTYNEYYNTYRDAIKQIEDNDKDFYRYELSNLVTRMDPCYFGYRGISTFSSMAYMDYSQAQYSLGMFGNRINSYTYNPQTPVYNMMFNIKYLIHNGVAPDLTYKYYKKVYTTSSKKADVYENMYNLPISFAVNKDIEDWECVEGNPFEVQSDFFSYATGISDVFEEVEYISCDLDGLTGDDVTSNGTFWIYKNDADSTYGSCNLTIQTVNDGNAYIYVTSPDVNSIDVSSDTFESHHFEIDEPFIIDLGEYKAGDLINVTINGGEMDGTEGTFDIYTYTLNHDKFERGYNLLKESSLNVTRHTDTSIYGDITVKQDSYLYTSIPYDDCWSIYIDGKKSDTFNIDDSSLCTMIKPGKHTVEFRYNQKGLYYGAALSAFALIGICSFGLISTKITKIRAKKKTDFDEIVN